MRIVLQLMSIAWEGTVVRTNIILASKRRTYAMSIKVQTSQSTRYGWHCNQHSQAIIAHHISVNTNSDARACNGASRGDFRVGIAFSLNISSVSVCCVFARA